MRGGKRGEASYTFPLGTTVIEVGTCDISPPDDRKFIKKITIPETVTRIGRKAVSEDFPNVEIVVLGTNVKGIDDFAFMGCDKLQAMCFPAALVCIGTSAFERCTGLKSIEWPAVPYRSSSQNVASPNDVIPALRTIRDSAFKDCKSLKTVSLNGCPVNTIGTNAFMGCEQLHYVEIDINTITHIGETPFAGCSPHLNLSVGNIPTEDLEFPNHFQTINNLDRWGCHFAPLLSTDDTGAPDEVMVAHLWPASDDVQSCAGFAQNGTPINPHYRRSDPTEMQWLDKLQRVKTNLPDETVGAITIPAFDDIGDETLRGALIAAYPSLAHRSPWSIRLPGKVAHQMGAPVHSELINDISIKLLGLRIVKREINLDFNFEIYFIRADQNGMVGTGHSMPNRPVVRFNKRVWLHDACC